MPRLGIITGGMPAYRSFNHPDLFLSLKRDLAMVSNSAYFSFIFVYLYFITQATLSLHILGYATSLCGRGVGKDSRNETRAALNARDTIEAQLGALKDKQAQMAGEVKQALKEKASAEAGLKTTER